MYNRKIHENLTVLFTGFPSSLHAGGKLAVINNGSKEFLEGPFCLWGPEGVKYERKDHLL